MWFGCNIVLNIKPNVKSCWKTTLNVQSVLTTHVGHFISYALYRDLSLRWPSRLPWTALTATKRHWSETGPRSAACPCVPADTKNSAESHMILWVLMCTHLHHYHYTMCIWTSWAGTSLKNKINKMCQLNEAGLLFTVAHLWVISNWFKTRVVDDGGCFSILNVQIKVSVTFW